jgi:hypothetical protein
MKYIVLLLMVFSVSFSQNYETLFNLKPKKQPPSTVQIMFSKFSKNLDDKTVLIRSEKKPENNEIKNYN